MLRILFTKFRMWLFKKNSINIIKNGNSDEIWKLLKHFGYELTEDEQLALIERGNHEELMFLLKLHTAFFDSAQVALIKRKNDEEIEKLLSYADDLCTEALQLIAKRNHSQEIESLLQHHNIFKQEDKFSDYLTYFQHKINQERNAESGNENASKEKTIMLKYQILKQHSTEIVNKGDSQEIISMLKSLKHCYADVLDKESRDKIILRGNPEEITAYLDSNYLPSEKAIVYLIDNGFYELARRCLNIDCNGYSPITEKVVAAVLEKGDELLVLALLRHTGQLPHLLKHWNKQEWFEKQILARGSKDEISSLARIYKVSDYTVDEILRRNVGQEIKALIDGKNISDAHIYKLIDLQRYDLLENYARCVPNNPTFYLLTKYMKAHR